MLGLGNVMQLGYIVPSIEAAVDRWTALGVGPFYGGAPFTMGEYEYRGVPGPCTLRVALAYSGDMQIELLEPIGEARTLYSDAARAAPGQLNHLAMIVADVERLVAERGWGDRIVQRGNTIAGRFAYVEGQFPDGSLLELIEDHPLIRHSCTFIGAAARDWDGSRPLRPSTEVFQAMTAPE